MLRQKVKGLGIRLRRDGVFQSLGFILDACRPGRQIVLQMVSDCSRTKAAPSGITILSGVEHLQRLRKGQLPEAFYRDEEGSGRRCFVALCGDELAGVLWVFDEKHPSSFFDLKRDEAELGNGYVLNRFRRRGAFQRLIAEACSALSAEGYSSFYAIVDERNVASLKAFEMLSFRRVGGISRPLANLFGVKFRAASQPGAYPARETSRQAPPMGETPVPTNNPAPASAVALAEPHPPHPASPFHLSTTDVLSCSLAESSQGFRKRWSDFVSCASYGHYHQSFEFARIRQIEGWEVQFFWTENEERIVTGSLVLSKFIPFLRLGLSVMPSGPLWLSGQARALATLLEAIGRDRACRGVVFCRSNMRCPAEEFQEVTAWLSANRRDSPQTWSYWNLSRSSMWIDVSGSLDDVIRRMHRRVREEYRKGRDHGLRVYRGGLEKIPELVRILNLTAERKETRARDETFFSNLLQLYDKDDLNLVLAEANSEVIGAAVEVTDGSRAYWVYGGFDYSKRHLYPNVALQVEMIRWAQERGCNYYDIGDTCTSWPPAEGDNGYGVYQFKRRLGARVTLRAPYCDFVYRPFLYRLAVLVENVGLPLALERGRSKILVALRRLRIERGLLPADGTTDGSSH